MRTSVQQVIQKGILHAVGGLNPKKSRKCSLIPSAPVVLEWNTYQKPFSLPSSRPHAQLITLLSLSFAPIPNEKSRSSEAQGDLFFFLEARERNGVGFLFFWGSWKICNSLQLTRKSHTKNKKLHLYISHEGFMGMVYVPT